MAEQQPGPRWRRRIGIAACAVAAWTTAEMSVVPGAANSTTRQWSQAELFVELNHTDSDLGLHAAIDGDPWTRLEIEGPRKSPLLSVLSRGRLRSHGMTQLAFESAEPAFEDLAPEIFFRRFPEGRYQIDGRAADGAEFEGVALLSHVLAAPPDNVLVSGLPAAENCDAPLPHVHPPVRIEWTQ